MAEEEDSCLVRRMNVLKVSEEDLRQMKRDREKMSEEFQHFLEMNLKKSSHDDNKSQKQQQMDCDDEDETKEQKVLHSLNVTQVVRNLNESPRSPLKQHHHLSPGMKTQQEISSSTMSFKDLAATVGESPMKTIKSGGDEKKTTPPHGKEAPSADVEASQCKKVKNYDPIEARRYMRVQQKKRQLELKQSLTMNQARKTEIQKRLSELQENTRKIFNKSLKLKDVKRSPGKKSNDRKVIVDEVKNSTAAIINGPTGSQQKKKPAVTQDAIKGNNAIKKSPRTCATESYAPLRLNFHRERIETKVPQGVNTNDSDKNLPTVRNISRKFDNKSRQSEESEKVAYPAVEKLKVPEYLKLTPSKGDRKKRQSKGNLPHWLRPTTVNTHPPDFITSVREKLDAISNATLEKATTKDPLVSFSSNSAKSDSRKDPDKWTDLNRWTLQQEYNAKRSRSISQSLEEPLKSTASLRKKSDNKSASDGLLTNFSSISIHLPDSNTISDISSIQSEIFPSSIRMSTTKITNRSERASVSDGGKSPEEISVKGVERIGPIARDNNQLSPLSTEMVDTMRIMSPPGKRGDSTTIAKVTPHDGNTTISTTSSSATMTKEGDGKIGEFNNQLSDKFRPLDTSTNRASEAHEGNLSNLLDAFNRSLSQVIQMNQQLYSTLNRSPENVAQSENEQVQQKVIKSVENAAIGDNVKEKKSPAGKEINGDEVKEEAIESGKIDLDNCRDNRRDVEECARVFGGNLMDAKETNSTIGSDIFAVFNQTDMEVSYTSAGGDDARETSITYSNIGMMIKTEKMKGDHLMTMIKMREKALIDRTRGQIAWLELQKKRFREKGKILEISAIRKKQRAILLKLERERAELQRQMRIQSQTPLNKSPRHRVRVVEKTISNVVTLRRSPLPFEHRGAIKGYEIETGSTLEQILAQREKELQKRKQHVEFLMQWHQRLEREENDVRMMENHLLSSNLDKLHQKSLPALTNDHDEEKDDEALKRVEDIDRSLQILDTIVQEGGSDEECVTVRGIKLNLLWRKLVGREEEKFLPENVYKMTKGDFSHLYEEAKDLILKEFHNEKNMRELLEESMASASKESISHYSSDDFETVTTTKEIQVEPEASGEESKVESEESDTETKSQSVQEPLQEESTRESSPEEAFSQEMLTEINEDQLISETTLPSFNETTIPGETTIDEVEEVSENSIPENNSHDIFSIVNDDEIDKDLSVHSTNENHDKSISSEESVAQEDEESVVTESFQDEEPEEESKESPSELEQRIIEVDVSLKDLSSVMENSPIMEALSPREDTSTSSSPDASQECQPSTSSEKSESPAVVDEDSSSARFIQEAYAEIYPKSPDEAQNQAGAFGQQKIRDYKIPNRMPDIISEAELLRRQQMQIEQEIKQLEQSVPAVFLREIPNKPPPPYVPPAQDSPLATIFPSEERIVEMVSNRTKELYISGITDAEKADCPGITNVYEKIIVGMCDEMYSDIKESLDTTYDAPFQRVRLFQNKLSFFNPPDRLKSIQQHILESIGKILPGPGIFPRQSLLHLPANSRRKRDQIDEIVIEEMLEDDWKWSNFQIEEAEVLDTMTETIFSTLLEDAIRDIDVAFTRKYSSGTTK
ncbi:centrosome-associated protein 350 [Sergentomyia squamirostris]